MINFSIIAFLISIIFLIIAVFYDVKYRLIPNILIIIMLLVACSLAIIESIYCNSWSYLLNSLFAGFIAFLATFVLWNIGVFAGGDLKLFVALAFLNPQAPAILSTSFYYASAIPLFILVLIVASLFSALPYLLLLSLYYLIAKCSSQQWNWFVQRKFWVSSLASILVVFLISSVVNLFYLATSLFVILILIFLMILLFSMIRRVNSIIFNFILCSLYVILFLFVLLTGRISVAFKISDLITIVVCVVIADILQAVYKIIKTQALRKQVLVAKLKEGDIPVNNYYWLHGKLKISEIGHLAAIRQKLSGHYSKNLKIDSHNASGIAKEDITFLKRMYKNRLIDRQIWLKASIPFTPAVLIGYLFLAIAGELLCIVF
jgi:archaeal preflagellin peptidase FlaK